MFKKSPKKHFLKKTIRSFSTLLQGQSHAFDADPVKDGILGIEAETHEGEIAASCAQSYEDENGEIYDLLTLVGNEKNHVGENNAMVYCRFDNTRVGHHHLSFRTMSMGRVTNTWGSKFFDSEGKTGTV